MGLVSLGCSKNQVDAERMLYLLKADGFQFGSDPALCDVVMINTCGFIEDAKKESIENILEFAALKKEGRVKVIVVTGCLAERYREEMAKEIPEVDVILGIGSNADISAAIRSALAGKKVMQFGKKDALSLDGDRILVNLPYFAYLKVAEGCDNRCSYCAIPLIRGNFRSRRMEDILEEATLLVSRGVTELNVVAQDTTRYGEDIYKQYKLPELLTKLCAIEGLHWVRVLYCYPDRITDELLDVMAKESKIVKYMDIPVQHVSGNILTRMNRKGNRQSLTALMEKIRQRVPNVTLRTTMIVGFPGETESDFEELCLFIKAVRFERLGCFTYSQEEDTPAAGYEDQIEEEIKRHRADIVMETQMDIAAAFGENQIGRILEVLCEGYDRLSECYFGRSTMDAPDIDTKVFFTSTRTRSPGDYVHVEITEAMDYDLIGVEQE